MKKVKNEQSNDELRSEYDFDYSKATRGKYIRKLVQEGSTKRPVKRAKAPTRPADT
jgi:hypothetical protein